MEILTQTANSNIGNDTGPTHRYLRFICTTSTQCQVHGGTQEQTWLDSSSWIPISVSELQ